MLKKRFSGTYLKGVIMNRSELIEQSTKLLSTFRMTSINNMAFRLNKNLNELLPVLDILQKNKVLRIAPSKTCSSSCNSCETCIPDKHEKYSGDEIIISLVYKGEDEDVN